MPSRMHAAYAHITSGSSRHGSRTPLFLVTRRVVGGRNPLYSTHVSLLIMIDSSDVFECNKA